MAEGQRPREGWQRRIQNMLDVRQDRTHCSLVQESREQKIYATDEVDGENAEESTEHEEDLQAWCFLEESENEQWQDVISNQNKRKVKKANQASLLKAENNHTSNPKKIVEVKDKWAKVRVTMDSGAAGHVMPETMLPRVKLGRKATPKKFVAANGEQIEDLGEKYPIQDERGNPEVHNIQKCKCCQTPHFNAKGRPSW